MYIKNILRKLKIYIALIKISEISHENEISLQFAKQSIDVASTTLGRVTSADSNLVVQFKMLNQAAFQWLEDSQKQYKVKDFGYVFEKYINN